MPSRAPEYQPGLLIPGTIYKVLKVIGQGGMGTVYEVEDTSVGKRYVLKTLHGNLADREDLAQRLAREARALARLQHPNIIEVYTSGKTNDALKLPYYVMERLVGHTLRTVLDEKGRIEVDRACEIAIDLLDALDHAHENHIVHRDVKPDNIFLTRNREGRHLAKLIDFGIIKLATAASSATLHTGGRFIGTFRYAAPEQISGGEITPRTDLYSAALVIYEMVAGRGPFDEYRGEMDVGVAHAKVPAPALSRYANVPTALEEVVMAALQKDPERRPRDAFTFASTLRRLKRGDAPTAVVDYQGSTVLAMDLPPMSAARPVQPFVTEGPSGTPPVPPSDDATRVDGPAAMNASTLIADRTSPLPSGQPQTVSAAPLSVALAPAHVMVDRHAETREAAPHAPPPPRFDTAPIPLAVVAPKAHPPVETFGPHTTETSQRRRTMRLGATLGIAGVVLIGAAAFIVALRHPRATQGATGEVVPPETVSSAALEPVTVPSSSAVVPVVTAQPTVVEQPAPPAPTETVKRTAPTHAPRPTTVPAVSPSAVPADTNVRHHVGSGL